MQSPSIFTMCRGYVQINWQNSVAWEQSDVWKAVMLNTPETELLLICSRLQLDDGAVSRMLSLLQQELDWQLIFQLADAHRTVPMLAFHLNQHAMGHLANDIRGELQTHHRNNTQHNLVLAMEVLRLMNLMETAGIQAVPFKGPVAAMLVYGDMAMRSCGDIDLLVKRNDHGKAERLLIAEGYRVQACYPGAMQSSLWHEQRLMSIDLHWGIPPDELKLNSDPLWEDLEPINLLGRPVLTFSPHDTLVVMAINATKEYWRPSLHHLSDIAALTRSYTGEDWGVAFRRARQIGSERMLTAAVLFAHRLLNVDLPAVVPARLLSHPGINKVVDELQDHLLLLPDEQTFKTAMEPVRHRNAQDYYLTLTDSPWQRGNNWLKWVLTPNAADQVFIQLPKPLSFLYYLIRPLRLLLKSR